MFLKLLSALFLFFLGAASGNAESIEGAGVQRLDVADPVGQSPMEAVAFFPSSDRTEVTSVGPYQIAASRSASIRGGHYPLILMSHGTMGSMWGHHDLASSLAQQGYIVVSVTHPGDNFQDASRIGTTSTIYGRPMHISAALTAALDDPELAPHIDRDRIGFVGFSAGGTTGLILAGARPVLARLEDYCANRPDDRSVCEAQGRIGVDRADLTPSADPRIRSFVLLAPLSVVFPPEELERVTTPMLVYVGEKDEELSPEENALALARDMPSKARLQAIPDAGHFTFLAPCSPQLSDAMPALCTDHPGLDRAVLHRSINANIAAFFTDTLDVATP